MKPTTDQLQKINQKALSPLTEDEVYVFPCKVIGDNLIPKYNLRLRLPLLQKFVSQMQQGVALLVDHPWMKWGALAIPYGRTFDSRLQSDGDELAVYADHYMKLGQEFEGISTDNLAGGIDAGTIFDTSAGFVVTKMTCSICGDPYFNSDCPHISGRTYGDNSDLCFLWGDDGYIMENSLVFDGAYETAGVAMKRNGSAEKSKTDFIPLDLTRKTLAPGAEIYCAYSKTSGMKAFVSATSDASAEPTEQTHQINLSQTAGEQGDDQRMSKELEQALSAAKGTLGEIRTALGVQVDGDIMTALNVLLAKAKDGETYKTEMIEEACGAGVRALGSAFDVEAIKASLAHLPVAQVKKFRDSYEAQAKVNLGGGGQHVVSENHQLPENPTANPNAPVVLSAEEKAEKERQDAREAARAMLKRTGNERIMKEGE